MSRCLLLWCLLGCDAVEDDFDAFPLFEADAANLDAAEPRADGAPAVDLGGAADRGADPPDLAPVEPDAEPSADAAPPTDHGPCAVRGTAGRCVHVDDCADFATPGFCPGPVEIQCCTLEDPDAEPPVADCDPDAHPQPNVGLMSAPGEGGCPAGMRPVDAFCVDTHEAALVDLDGAPWSPYHNPGDRRLVAVSLAGAVPQGYIDGEQAAAACAEAGKRLCTDAEWLRACRGVAARTFPYGEARRPGVCNDARAVHPAVELFPDDPNPFDRIQHPCINQLDDGLAPTGEHAECVTPEGVFDLMGNLHEWTADPSGTFRGGFYVDTVRNGPGCLYATTAHNRLHWDYSTGFRCCADR